MKPKKILRPEIEVEYVGVKGFLLALFAICKTGIKKVATDYCITTVKGDIATYKRYYAYVLPKYKFKKVRKLSESEVQEDETCTSI